jgi:hypothetical protein
VAYDDWDSEFQEVWDDIPGTSYLTDEEIDTAQDLYEAGFTHHSDEVGYDSDDVKEARYDFFEYMGLEYDDFPWDEWQEAMGY